MEKQRPRTARTNLTKNKGGQLTVRDVETHYKARVIATASYRHRDKCIRQENRKECQENRKECPERDSRVLSTGFLQRFYALNNMH